MTLLHNAELWGGAPTGAASHTNAGLCGGEMITICIECKQSLINDEIEYYENRCEKCESEWADEMYRWRHGEKNEKFDAMYSAPNPTIN